jgi:hypothetical protein
MRAGDLRVSPRHRRGPAGFLRRAAAYALALVLIAAAVTLVVTRPPLPSLLPDPPVPTPTPEPFALRTEKPNGSNVGTGVIRPPPRKLATSADGTWNDGVLTITKDLRNRIVNGTVKIGKDGLEVENNVIRGDPEHPPTSSRYLVDTGGGYVGTRVRWNDLSPTFPTPHFNAVGPRNVVAEFNDVSHVTDGFVPAPRDGVLDVNMVIRGNYVHDFAFYAPDPGHDPTPLMTVAGEQITGPWAGLPWNHADAVQVEVDGTTGVEVYGNTFVATWADDGASILPLPNAILELSCFMLNAGDDLVIEDNWLDGGEYAVNNADPAVTGTFARNRFGRRMAHTGTGDRSYFALMLAAPGLRTHDGTPDQNVWADTGTLVPRREN